MALKLRIKCGQEVVRISCSDGRWDVSTSNGPQGLFDVVVTAIGVLHYPAISTIEGLSDFVGPVLTGLAGITLLTRGGRVWAFATTKSFEIDAYGRSMCMELTNSKDNAPKGD